MEENNRLIAEFMGGINEMPKGYILYCCIPNKLCENTHFFKPENMEFHSSWDWLMPVVIKIKNLDHIEGYDFNIFEPLNDALLLPTMEDVYTVVVECIKWYNENRIKSKYKSYEEIKPRRRF